MINKPIQLTLILLMSTSLVSCALSSPTSVATTSPENNAQNIRAERPGFAYNFAYNGVDGYEQALQHLKALTDTPVVLEKIQGQWIGHNLMGEWQYTFRSERHLYVVTPQTVLRQEDTDRKRLTAHADKHHVLKLFRVVYYQMQATGRSDSLFRLTWSPEQQWQIESMGSI